MKAGIDPTFWKGKRVLVTGHTGFKGAWLSLILSQVGAVVTGVSLPPEEPSLYTQAKVASVLKQSHYTDLSDYEAVLEVLEAAKPEIVLHLAAQSLVRRAYREPRQTFTSNVLGTVNLLDALRTCPSMTSILITTTDKVYLNLEDGRPFREADPLGGSEPYGASKAAAEMVISAYRESYFTPREVPLLTARAGNVIGGGDWSEDRILPDIIRAVMAKQPVRIRNPKGVRPWQHVLDALEGYILLVQSGAKLFRNARSGLDLSWNFGPDTASEMIEVAQLCQWVQEAWPDTFSWTVDENPDGIKESQLLLLNPVKAMTDLSWHPRWTPRDAVRQSLDWYARFLAGGDAYRISIDAIEDRFNFA